MTASATWLYIDEKGQGRINGDKRYSFDLPAQWNIGELEYAFLQACVEYDLETPQDDAKLHRIITNAIKSYGKQVTEQKHQQDSGEQASSDTEEKPADLLYNLARTEITEMFRDEETQAAYAVMTIDGTRHVLNMESEQFKLKLRILHENHIAATPNTELSQLISETDLNKVVQQLLARNDTHRILYLRSYFDGSTAYYDFMNKEYQYAVITPEGYSIKDDSFHIFKRYDEYHAQILPDKESTNGGALFDNAIKSFNLIDNEYGDKNLLFRAATIALFIKPQVRPTMPIWSVNGPEGSSKTSLLLYVKDLKDPINGNPKSMVHRWRRGDKAADDRALIVSQNDFVIFDNLSHLSEEDSDEMCVYSTGGRHGGRKLYTNTDMIRYELQGNVGYTSINDVAKQSDLISRQLKFQLDIRTENMAESIFWSMKAKEKPAVLHYIFMTIGRAIPIYNKLTGNPWNLTSHRLADFILLCEAISQAIGQPEGRIIELFKRVEQEQAERSINNSSFASFFADYILNKLQQGADLEIQSSELFDGIKQHAAATNYDTFNDVDFPKNAIQLGKKIERLRPSLLKFNIDIRKGQHTSKGTPYRIRTIQPKPDTDKDQKEKIEQVLTTLHEMVKPTVEETPIVQLFACPICDHNANDYELLERHAVRAHPGKNFAALYQENNRKQTTET